LNSLLEPTASHMTPFSTQVFVDYFKTKIDVIRASTCGASPPVVNTRQAPPFSTFDPFSVDAVSKAINTVANKQCQLAPAPTWLVKQCSDILAPICSYPDVINSSFQQACFPEMYKTAVVKPLLKKSNMDPFEKKSYRPVSNLPFISEVIERLAMNCFTRHAETHQLFPLHLSTCIAYHSTETAMQPSLMTLLGQSMQIKSDVPWSFSI